MSKTSPKEIVGRRETQRFKRGFSPTKMWAIRRLGLYSRHIGRYLKQKEVRSLRFSPTFSAVWKMDWRSNSRVTSGRLFARLWL